MALIGRHRAPCASCDHQGVHVKQNEGKLPFLHCPNCGLVTHAKNGAQAAGLLARMRPEGVAPPVPPVAAKPIEVPAGLAKPAPMEKPMEKPAEPARRAGLWDSLIGGKP